MSPATIVILLILSMIGVVSIRSYCKRLSSGCCGTGGDNDGKKKIKVKDRNQANYPYCKILRVDGMVCSSCAVRVENAFHSREGFLTKADLGENIVVVYMKQPHEDAELKEIVRGCGYTVMGIKEETGNADT